MFDGFRLVDSLLTFFLRLQGIGAFISINLIDTSRVIRVGV